jgi:hypothetical protein
MRKKYNKTKRYLKKRNKKRKTKKYLKKGGNGETVRCVICDREVSIGDTLVPMSCLKRHGKRAHRICNDCWWDPVRGFARENVPHGCPGCKRGLPLNEQLAIEPETIEID